MDRIRYEEMQWEPYGKCAVLSNGDVEVIVTLDVGPRIMRYALPDGPNMFADHLNAETQTEWGTYKIKGGHRIWHAPEVLPRTYEPDDVPVEHWAPTNTGIQVQQGQERHTGMQKELEVVLDMEGTGVRVIQQITNGTVWPMETALWSISVMAAAGVEVIPLPENDTSPLHNRTLTLWPYSHFRDSRVRWGDRLVYLRQDPIVDYAFKMGVNGKDGWAAYLLNDLLFVKRYQPQPGMRYPDSGMTYETYVNGQFLEMETLSPLTRLAPGEGIRHEERWVLKQGVQLPLDKPEEVERLIDEVR